VGISASLTLISLSEDLFDSRPAFIGSLYLSVMTTARLIHSSMTSYVSSSNADLPANVVEGPPLSDEASPLLKPKHTHADRLSTFNSWSSALSSFFDVNTGLLLVAASPGLLFSDELCQSRCSIVWTSLCQLSRCEAPRLGLPLPS
jgi:hypothetical protein